MKILLDYGIGENIAPGCPKTCYLYQTESGYLFKFEEKPGIFEEITIGFSERSRDPELYNKTLARFYRETKYSRI